MAKRGRQSATEKEIESNVANFPQNGVVDRPEAPQHLTIEQKKEWDAVVERLPADWFPRETQGLLEQYCRHKVSADKVAELVQNEQNKAYPDIETLDRLLKMQEREGRALSSLATRMRITQQSTIDAERRKPKASNKKPWEQ